MKQAGQEGEVAVASEAGINTPWAVADFEMGEMKRVWSGEVNEEALKLNGSVSGLCPVQGEGELDGKPWYFRSRHEHWTFTMAEADGDPHGVRSMFHEAALEGGWNIEREWPFGQFSAGCMPVKAALAIIRACARLYWAGKLPRKEADAVKYAEETRMLSEWFDSIREASYCECSHNQPQHGIHRKEVEVAGVETPLQRGQCKCQECDCKDFHYSAAESQKQRKLETGESPDDGVGIL